jgi:hypothetical protein
MSYLAELPSSPRMIRTLAALCSFKAYNHGQSAFMTTISAFMTTIEDRMLHRNLTPKHLENPA